MIRLRYLGHNLEVPEGQFIIGRSSKCQLSIDDPLISRQHAALTVTGDTATVEDLGSRNGISVNGKKVVGVKQLVDGDNITVGSQSMTIHGIVDGATAPPRTPHRAEYATLQTSALYDASLPTDELTDDTTIRPSPFKTAPDKRVNELSLVGTVAEKALALGRADDAHRILERPLREILSRTRGNDGQGEDPAVAQRAVVLAVRLATASSRGEWIDFAFDLYSLRRELLPQPVVDELYTTLRKVRCDGTKLSDYLEILRQDSARFGPNERFQISRIEGLEPFVGLK